MSLTDLEIALGSAIATQNAIHRARMLNEANAVTCVRGSRDQVYAHANIQHMDEAYYAIESATRHLSDALGRERRLIEMRTA